jgi:hypothetical protein
LVIVRDSNAPPENETMSYEAETRATQKQKPVQLFWRSEKRTFAIPSNRIAFHLSLQSAIQLLSALEMCACRENELLSKRGCHSIGRNLLVGESANLEYLFDKYHSQNCAKSTERRENCDFLIALGIRWPARREKPHPSPFINKPVRQRELLDDSCKEAHGYRTEIENRPREN